MLLRIYLNDIRFFQRCFDVAHGVGKYREPIQGMNTPLYIPLGRFLPDKIYIN